MSAQSPTKRQLELIDRALFDGMRVQTAQQLLEIAMPGDTPRGDFEYQLAYNEAARWIVRCQPDCLNANKPPVEAFRLSPDCPLSPYDLIALWARAGLLHIALKRYHDGLGVLLATLETAGSFANDDLLLCGVKLSFVVAALLTSVPESTHDLILMTGVWQKILTSTRDERCAQTHSEPVRELSSGMYFMLEQFGMINMNRSNPYVKGALGLVIKETAKKIDQKTTKRFLMEEWAQAKLNTI